MRRSDERRLASCYGKQSLTKAAADRIVKRSAHPVQPYKCEFCKGWHVGGMNTGKMRTDRRHKDDS